MSRTAAAPTTPSRRFRLIPTMSAVCAASERIRRPPPAMKIGGMGALHGCRKPDHLPDLIVPALERGRGPAQQSPEDRHGLQHPLHAGGGRVVGDPALLVIGPQPAGADPDLQPPAGKQIDRRQLLGKDRGMAEVVVQDLGADAEPRGGGRRRCHGGDGTQHSADKVVGEAERPVAELLDPPAGPHELGARRNRREVADRERERSLPEVDGLRGHGAFAHHPQPSSRVGGPGKRAPGRARWGP